MGARQRPPTFVNPGGTPENLRYQVPHEPTDETRQEVQEAVQSGIPHASIARSLGITTPTLTKYYGEILATGKEKVVRELGKNLVQQAREGNQRALEFYLRTQGRQFGFSEKVEHEVTGADGGPVELSLNINFVGGGPKDALPDHGEVVDVDPEDG